MKKELISLQELLSAKKLARIKNNRIITDKNVSEKKQSIKENGVLQPITIYDGNDVVKWGYKIVDLETGKEILEDQSGDYVVIIDGQHRITAYLELQKDNPEFDKPCYVMYSLADGITISKELAEINVTVRTWKGSDYPSHTVMTIGEEKYPLITEIANLTSDGYSLEAACKYLTFKNEITKAVLIKVSENKISESLKTKITFNKGIERGKMILEAASSRIKKDLLKTRIFPDWIIGKYDDLSESETGSFMDDICNFFKSLMRDQIDKIETVKGERGNTTKEDIIFRLLNEYYEQFKQPELKEAV